VIFTTTSVILGLNVMGMMLVALKSASKIKIQQELITSVAIVEN